MPIFKQEKNKLIQIKERKFDLEKEIQKVTEENLENIFGYEFIDSEFTVRDYRVDTFAYDPESNGFIIIEYKRDRNSSTVDQGVTYIKLLTNYEADFVLKFNEVTKKSFTKKDIDWRQSKVILIANRFTKYQREAEGFMGLPIELWEAKKFGDNLFSFEKVINQTEDKTASLFKKTPEIKAALKDTKRYTVDEHFKATWTQSRVLFDGLSEKLMELDDRLELSPQKHYIGYKIGNKIVFAIDVYKSCLNFSLPRTLPSDVKDPQKRVTLRKNSMKHYNQNISDFRFSEPDDIEYAVFLAKQSLEKFK